MSGAWAREADARGAHLLPGVGLARAAKHLAFMLETDDDRWLLSETLILASAIIRRERKSLDAVAPRLPDWSAEYDDNRLIWVALRSVAYSQTVEPDSNGGYMAYQLREAEAALRTLHKRGRA